MSSGTSPKVYIIVLNWNGWQDTLECLESISQLNYSNFQVIVVDNGSSDDSVEQLSSWLTKKDAWVLLQTGANLGYAAGNNVALRWALQRDDFSYVWILNNDVVVDPDALTWLVRRMAQKPGAGICGPAVLQYQQRNKIASLGEVYDRWQAHGWHLEAGKIYDPTKLEKYRKLERRIDYIVGAALLVSRDFLRDIGLMGEEYFLFFEEIDWMTRARGRYSLALAPEAIVYHKISGSFKNESGVKEKIAPFFDYYMTRNRLLFTRKYYAYALPTVYLSIFGYLLDRLARGAWGNVRAMLKAMLLKLM